jgi:hypothetical protein
MAPSGRTIRYSTANSPRCQGLVDGGFDPEPVLRMDTLHEAVEVRDERARLVAEQIDEPAVPAQRSGGRDVLEAADAGSAERQVERRNRAEDLGAGLVPLQLRPCPAGQPGQRRDLRLDPRARMRVVGAEHPDPLPGHHQGSTEVSPDAAAAHVGNQ